MTDNSSVIITGREQNKQPTSPVVSKSAGGAAKANVNDQDDDDVVVDGSGR